MPRSRIIFLVILGAAVLVVVLINFVVPSLPAQPTATPLAAIRVEVAANPLAYAWVSAQATFFNQQQERLNGRLIQVTVTSQDGVGVWYTSGAWSSQRHPALWIPEARFALDYAAEMGLNFDLVSESVAHTPLMWGVFADRATVMDKLQTSLDPQAILDWNTFQAAAAEERWQDIGGAANWGFVKAAFAHPRQSTAGFGVLLSAAAAHHRTEALSPTLAGANDFLKWLEPVVDAVPSFATLGMQPALVLANRGASTADFALLPESEWLNAYAGASTFRDIRFIYPAYKLTFDMPIGVWSGADMPAEVGDAARRFAQFLGQGNPQRAVVSFGLRPAKTLLTTATAPLFAKAVDAGLRLEEPPGIEIAMPNRTAALSLINWFQGYRRAP